MTRRRGLGVCALLWTCLLGGSWGCAGYRFTPVHREDVRTVAVPIFDNTTYVYGLEAALTEAVIKEFERTTPWTVAAETVADTTLTGVITAADLRVLGTTPTTGLVQEQGVDIAVDFEWRDNRTGEPLLGRRSFRATGAFAPARGAAEPIEVGRRRAIAALAKDIVAELRSQW